MVEVEVANRSGVAVDEQAAAELTRAVLAEEGISNADVGLTFVGPDEARQLKQEHLGVDEAPDVLAFPIDARDPLPEGVPRQLGDIVICPELTGGDWGVALVHGLLHLLGYDHGAEMEAREAAHEG